MQRGLQGPTPLFPPLYFAREVNPGRISNQARRGRCTSVVEITTGLLNFAGFSGRLKVGIHFAKKCREYRALIWVQKVKGVDWALHGLREDVREPVPGV